MSDNDPLAALAAMTAPADAPTTEELRVRPPGPPPRRPYHLATQILLHILGWLYILCAVGVLAYTFLGSVGLAAIAGMMTTKSELALPAAIGVILVALGAIYGGLYLFVGLAYVSHAFSMRRGTAKLAQVGSILILISIALEMGGIGWLLWQVSATISIVALLSSTENLIQIVLTILAIVWTAKSRPHRRLFRAPRK